MNISHILACPDCSTPLPILHCDHCNRLFKEHDCILELLPKDIQGEKRIEMTTYSHRAQFFNAKNMKELPRPNFCDPLRTFPKTATFLEVCAGEARHSLKLAEEGYRVIISDIAPGSVKKVRGISRNLPYVDRLAFAICDAEYLPFLESSIDAILITASFHHLPHPERALAEIWRVLKPGGVILVAYEPSSWPYYLFYPFFKLFRFLIRKQQGPAPHSHADDHTFGFQKRQLVHLFQKHRFRDVQVTPVDYTDFFYKKSIELYNKLFKKAVKTSPRVHRSLRTFDQNIAKIPGVRGLTFNWDIFAKK